MTKWITVSEASKILGISRQCVHDLVRRGKLGKTRYTANPDPKKRTTLIQKSIIESRAKNRQKKI